MQETLRKLTEYVRLTKGQGEALRFYVNHIQPIKEYFGGDSEVEKISLNVPGISSLPKCDSFHEIDEGSRFCKKCGIKYYHGQ